MNNRETKTIVTPTGHKIELYTYITGREKRALVNVFLDGKVNFNTDTQQVNGISANVVDLAQNLTWRTVIVSVDGKKEGEIDIVNTILDLRDIDFNFVTNAVNDITKDKDFEEKKTI
jgi:hypothetical protein